MVKNVFLNRILYCCRQVSILEHVPPGAVASDTELMKEFQLSRYCDLMLEIYQLLVTEIEQLAVFKLILTDRSLVHGYFLVNRKFLNIFFCFCDFCITGCAMKDLKMRKKNCFVNCRLYEGK